jgi:hypothetical protein
MVGFGGWGAWDSDARPNQKWEESGRVREKSQEERRRSQSEEESSVRGEGEREDQGGEDDKSMSIKLFIKSSKNNRNLCLNRIKAKPDPNPSITWANSLLKKHEVQIK